MAAPGPPRRAAGARRRRRRPTSTSSPTSCSPAAGLRLVRGEQLGADARPPRAGTTSPTGAGDDWWGVGPGAHSHVGGVRWWNVQAPARRTPAGSPRAQPGAGPRGARPTRSGATSGCCSACGSPRGCRWPSSPPARPAVAGLVADGLRRRGRLAAAGWRRGAVRPHAARPPARPTRSCAPLAQSHRRTAAATAAGARSSPRCGRDLRRDGQHHAAAPDRQRHVEPDAHPARTAADAGRAAAPPRPPAELLQRPVRLPLHQVVSLRLISIVYVWIPIAVSLGALVTCRITQGGGAGVVALTSPPSAGCYVTWRA